MHGRRRRDATVNLIARAVASLLVAVRARGPVDVLASDAHPGAWKNDASQASVSLWRTTINFAALTTALLSVASRAGREVHIAAPEANPGARLELGIARILLHDCIAVAWAARLHDSNGWTRKTTVLAIADGTGRKVSVLALRADPRTRSAARLSVADFAALEVVVLAFLADPARTWVLGAR